MADGTIAAPARSAGGAAGRSCKWEGGNTLILPDAPELGKDDAPELVLNQLLAHPPTLTVATAESCTGGAVAARIVSVAGSSGYFLGGIVAYSNEAKRRLLGVPPAVLASRGAVSAECARAMAAGARRAFGADIAVASTGIAGPGGATVRKPVGLVYIALATPAGVEAYEHHFAGGRAAVIAAATEEALRLLPRGVRQLGDGR